jgi:ribosome-binding factor A
MKTPSKRTLRVAEVIQRYLAQFIQHEIKDPRLPSWVTISSVELSSDFSYAKVYFTVLESDPKTVASILNSAAPYLRSHLGKYLTTRTVPQLQFVYDESLAYGRHLQSLIDKANPKDESQETS